MRLTNDKIDQSDKDYQLNIRHNISMTFTYAKYRISGNIGGY